MKMTIALPLALAGALLVTVPAGLTFAQSQPDTKAPAAEQRGPQDGERGRGWRREPPSPEMLQRMLDGRLAGAKAALRLTPEQERLWSPVEEVMRQNAAQRMAMREQMRGDRGERRDMLERLDTMGERLSTRATEVKKLAEALRPLYATLSDDQKDVLRYEMRHAMGGGMRGGRGHMRGGDMRGGEMRGGHMRGGHMHDGEMRGGHWHGRG